MLACTSTSPALPTHLEAEDSSQEAEGDMRLRVGEMEPGLGGGRTHMLVKGAALRTRGHPSGRRDTILRRSAVRKINGPWPSKAAHLEGEGDTLNIPAGAGLQGTRAEEHIHHKGLQEGAPLHRSSSC